MLDRNMIAMSVHPSLKYIFFIDPKPSVVQQFTHLHIAFTYCIVQVVKKVCTVCHKTEQDMTVVQYECRCVKLVCAKCSQQLREPSEDSCTAHPHYPRIDTKELREKLKHVPLEM